VTDVVRGADLLTSTPRQELLRETLGLPAVTYMHVPLAVDAGGLKLSKSEDAPGLAVAGPAAQAVAALEFLRQEPPRGLSQGKVADVWEWAASNWNPGNFAGEAVRRVPVQA
jgi:glutamyl-Q tRNA(Asp) synthetase